jgi:hypothetical protein
VGNRLLLLGWCSLAEPHKPREQGEACRPVIVFSSAVHPGATTKHLARTCDLSDTAETRVGPGLGMPAVSLY